MKRDMDLIRTILLEIENHQDLNSPVDIKGRGYSPEQITYHVRLLKQAGLIDAAETTSLDKGEAWIVRSLTWRGHEFLEAARNDTIWQKLKAEVKDRGISLPFQVIEALAMKFVAQHMGLSQ